MDKIVCKCHNQEFETSNKLYRHLRRFGDLEKSRTYDKEYGFTHKVERKEYREKTKEKDLDYHSTYYKENKKEHNLRVKKYKNTPKGRLISKLNTLNRRKYLEKSSKLTESDVQVMREHFSLNQKETLCILCFKGILKGEEDLEHGTPLSRIKEFPDIDFNSFPNLGFAHRSCNGKKFTKTLEEWFQLHPEYLIEGLNKSIIVISKNPAMEAMKPNA